MIRYVTSLVLFTFVISLGTWAQNSPPPHQHVATAAMMIDGSQHPELIPDLVAYRLYLLSVATTANPADKERARQSSHLGVIGLAEADRRKLVTILTEFKSQYDNLVDRYNESATAAEAQNLQPDITTFLQQRDDLVQSTRTALKRTLTTEGVSLFDGHVQREKKKMKIDAKEAQQ